MEKNITVTIESIDIEGRGIARNNGKTIFIDGALPGEIAEIEIYKSKANFDKAKVTNLLKKSSERITPKCPNFGICGGCSMQHLEFKSQVEYKEKVLIDNLKHIGKVTPNTILNPLYGEEWNYRHRARLSVRFVAKKGGTLVGFREKSSSFVADMNECLILPTSISDLIPQLRELINNLSIKDRIPQIEVAVGDEVQILVFRIMEQLTQTDEDLIKAFVDKVNMQPNSSLSLKPLQVWLQPAGPNSCYPFYPSSSYQLSYHLEIPKDKKLTIPYFPTEFTQVNPKLNNQMVNQALSLLQPQEDEKIADFFCGIGNFTLAIANFANEVLGIEGSIELVNRAKENAKYNSLGHKTNYISTNLFKVDEKWLIELGKFDKWLIDPPRDGAVELIKAITPQIAPKRIIYVSCNPATLARDAAILVNVHGYKLVQAGVMNMFPHTSHVESIAQFEL